MIKYHLFAFLITICLFYPNPVYSYAKPPTDKPYINVVIPFRGRDYWQQLHRVTPLFDFLIVQNRPLTVLIQYQNLSDPEIINYLKSFPSIFEIGLFLEVDESLANDTYSSYLYGIGDRAHANKILLSGYTVSERKRMIDRAFKEFFRVFKLYPKSVGAWYIDSVSLNYLQKKYSVRAVLDVADQYQTDTYGLWGKPWGIPYIPSKYNPLLPYQNIGDDGGIVKLQWAARDPLLGYGLTAFNSTYSVQANDYIKAHLLDNEYFKHLSDIYLFSPNTLNQLTVGLEAGQEGFGFLEEFKKQFTHLSANRFVTMEKFAGIFRQILPQKTAIAGKNFFNDNSGIWFNFPQFRAYFVLEDKQLILRDLRQYDNPFFFPDVFFKDKNKNLQRFLPFCLDYSLSGKQYILAAGIDNLQLSHDREDINLDFQGLLKNSRLTLNPSGIYFDGKSLYRHKNNILLNNVLIRFFYNLILEIQTGRRSNLYHGPLVSRIENDYYLGIPLYPDYLVGVKSHPPFAGIFKFPFQTLSKFKSPDFDSILFHFAHRFIKDKLNCKINL